MPPKKKLVTEYKWHRVPQYLRERSESQDDGLPGAPLDGDDSATISGSRTPTSTGSQQPAVASQPPPTKLKRASLSSPNLRANANAIAKQSDPSSDQSAWTDLIKLPWSFTKDEKVDVEATSDLVATSVAKGQDQYLQDQEEGQEVETEKRASAWILVDDGSGSDSDEDTQDNNALNQNLKDGHNHRKKKASYQEVITINGEIPIEAVILPRDRTRLDYNLFWKDVDKFLKEIPIFLGIQVRNWYALRGDGVRPWRIPTTVHTWWGEWGTFLSYFHDPDYWIKKYPSHLPGRYAWDTAISSHSALESYYKMRKRHKAPANLSWTCEGLDAKEDSRNVLWSYYGYDNTPSKFDFKVMVQVLPGDERLLRRCLASYILNQPGFPAMLRAAAYFIAWGSRRVPIYHHRDNPALGGGFTDTLELPFVTLHNAFPELKAVLYENVVPLDWQVYRQCIEDDPGIDPDLDIVHAYTNYDVRGGEGVEDYYGGQQFIICDRFQEDYDQPSGDWWYFPRNYRYEMQRGIGHISDSFTRTRAPLYERMVELSSVGHASDPRPPWRKGSFQNLGWFLDQFQFHFLPFLRRTKVALDLVTRPFSYRETSLSRLDGTLWLISRSCRILSKKRDFSSNSWKEFKNLVHTLGGELEFKMASLLKSLKPALKLFRTVHSRLAWASVQLEPAQSHWRILAGRSYYSLGCFRFDFLHGIFYNRHFKDRYYGVPGLYSSSRHKRQLDPYNQFWLEQWPLRRTTTKEGSKKDEEVKGQDQGADENNNIPGSETPPKPSFVPWDDAESVERIPWNLYWLRDAKKKEEEVHVHSPLEGRCVPLSTLGSGDKVAVFSALFQNAQDILDLSKEEVDSAMGAIYKYKDDQDIVFMSPTGPVGPKDSGYENLLRLMNDPSRVNPLDTAPLLPFDTLLTQWWDVVGQAATRKFRHMLGPGAYRLAQSLQQIFDLQEEVHLLLPHLEKMASFLKANLGLVRTLAGCTNRAAVLKFVLGSRLGVPALTSSLLRLRSQPFYVVRFSLGPEENAKLAKNLPGESVQDSLTSVEAALEAFYYVKNQHYEGYVRARGERRGVARSRMRLRQDRHRARMVGVELRGEGKEREEFYKSGRGDWRMEGCGPGAGLGVRRFSSADLFYLEDDRVERVGRIGVGRRFRKREKMDVGGDNDGDDKDE